MQRIRAAPGFPCSGSRDSEHALYGWRNRVEAGNALKSVQFIKDALLKNCLLKGCSAAGHRAGNSTARDRSAAQAALPRPRKRGSRCSSEEAQCA